MLAVSGRPPQLRWLPTGPGAVSAVLRWSGLPAVRVNDRRREPWQRRGRDRVTLVAAREERLLDAYDRARAERASDFRAAVASQVPERASVLVASSGDDALLELGGRPARHFPGAADGSFAGWFPEDSDAAIEELEALRRDGAEYLLLPRDALWWLESFPELAQHLSGFPQERERGHLVVRLGGASRAPGD
jgi:hypothetical protein